MTNNATTDAVILRDNTWSEHSRPLAASSAPPQADQTSSSRRSETAPGTEHALRETHADELSALFDEARERGYREGRETAEQACASKLQGLESELTARCDQRLTELNAASASLASLMRRLESERAQLVEEMEAVALEVAFAAVTKILGTPAMRGELMRDLLKRALQEVDRNHPVRIRLSTIDHARLFKSELISTMEFDSHAEFIADDTLPPGACLIENARGSLDASLGVQLSAFKELLITTYQTDRAPAMPHE